jgi:hypothetical protein
MTARLLLATVRARQAAVLTLSRVVIVAGSCQRPVVDLGIWMRKQTGRGCLAPTRCLNTTGNALTLRPAGRRR